MISEVINIKQLTSEGTEQVQIFHQIFENVVKHQVFCDGHWQLTGQQGKGRDHLLFYSTTSTRSGTFRHLLATLHMRWLSHIFNCTALIYQAITRWDLPLYRMTIWLSDDVILIFVFLIDDFILALQTRGFHVKTFQRGIYVVCL